MPAFFSVVLKPENLQPKNAKKIIEGNPEIT